MRTIDDLLTLLHGGYADMPERRLSVKAQLRQMVDEVIGKDDEANIFPSDNAMWPVREYFNANRRNLRDEQRQRANELFGIGGDEE